MGALPPCWSQFASCLAVISFPPPLLVSAFVSPSPPSPVFSGIGLVGCQARPISSLGGKCGAQRMSHVLNAVPFFQNIVCFVILVALSSFSGCIF
jgi:hypothetical protein